MKAHKALSNSPAKKGKERSSSWRFPPPFMRTRLISETSPAAHPAAI